MLFSDIIASVFSSSLTYHYQART